MLGLIPQSLVFTTMDICSKTTDGGIFIVFLSLSFPLFEIDTHTPKKFKERLTLPYPSRVHNFAKSRLRLILMLDDNTIYKRYTQMKTKYLLSRNPF